MRLLPPPDYSFFLFHFYGNLFFYYNCLFNIINEIITLKKLTELLILFIAFSTTPVFAQDDEHKDENYEVKPIELPDGTLYGTEIDAKQISCSRRRCYPGMSVNGLLAHDF